MAELDKPPAAKPRDRVLGDAEIAVVWKACAVIGAGEQAGVPAGWPFGPIIRLLLLTGARRDEIGALRWSEIVGGEISIAGIRTKNGEPHNVPLSASAAELIGTLPRIGESDHVFTTTGKTHVTGWSKAKHLLDQAAAQINGAPLAPWRLHDLRRTVATGMQRLGISLQVIEVVLGHLSGSRAGVVGVYQRHSFDREKRAALKKWATKIERILGKKPTTASRTKKRSKRRTPPLPKANTNVVPLRRAAK
jgi:integrase